MPAAGAIGAVTSLIGGMNEADAAESAAQAQADAAKEASRNQLTAAREAMALQRQQFDTYQQNQQPWMSAGTGSINRLANLMGIDTYTGGRPAVSNAPTFADFAKSMGYDPTGGARANANAGANLYTNPITGEVRNFTPQENTVLPDGTVLGGAGANYAAPAGTEFQMIGWQPVGASGAAAAGNRQGQASGPSLEELQRIYNEQYGAQQGQLNARGDDFGLLTKRFTQQDFYDDPVIQLGLEYGRKQGEKQLNARAAAGGGYFAGQTLKALTQFNQDYAGTKAGESRGRFIEDQGNLFNRYAGLSGVGQTAISSVGNAGANMATQSGNWLQNATSQAGQYGMAGANAMASGYQNSSNAMQGMMGNLGYFGGRMFGGTPSAGAMPTGAYGGMRGGMGELGGSPGFTPDMGAFGGGIY